MLLFLLGVAAALVVLYFVALIYFNGGIRRSDEPPLLRGLIPVLGVGIELNKDPQNYLFSLQKKYGDVVTLFLGGKRMHYFLNPLDYAKVYANKKTVDFDPVMEEFMGSIFGGTPAFNRMTTKGPIAKQYHSMVTSMLQGEALVDLTTKVQGRIQHHLFTMKDFSQWQEVNLAQFLAELLYRAATDSIMYPGFQDEGDFEKFKKFDNMFALLASGLVPSFLTGVAVKAREELASKFTSVDAEKCSDIVRGRKQLLDGIADASDVNRAHFAFFWAANSNTMIATFWAIIYLIHQAPETKTLIQEEMNTVMQQLRKEQGITSEDTLPAFNPDALQQMKFLDSCVAETFRLTSSASSFRQVTEETKITLESGKTYTLRQGDNVVLNAFLVNHDPEIYDNPSEFQVDRYVKNSKFTKDGKIIPSIITPFLFGGGYNVCPGRFFAKNEMRLVAAMLMNYMDIELIDKQIPLPKKQTGAGLNPPEHDVKVRMRVKEQFKNKLKQ